MTQRTAKCPICGQSFTPAAAGSRYCSEPCRQEGRRLARKAWEERTGYREKQRAAAQEYRERKAAAAALEAEAAAIRDEHNRRRRQARQAAKGQESLEAQARQGDLFAKLQLQKRAGGNATEAYWAAFQAVELAQEAANPGHNVCLVNGIAIGDPDFALKVVMTIEETGQIATTLL